ncbi:MAG: peptide-methionine (S)-S-oxide reductase MsrA [Rickettsiales bacterium]|nr:peptide-methionine (S)-S-oxide reductase MsrA [Rickettsiales bacterium]
MVKQTLGFALLASVAVIICVAARADDTNSTLSMVQSTKDKAATKTIVLAGGCFWGIEAVYQHTKGVVDAVSGYSGGDANQADYSSVSSGNSGHAEAVQVTYDPAQISLDSLLDIYFTVAHNPTQLNYQGPDHGTQYRSAIFYNSEDDKQVIDSKINALAEQKTFKKPIVTKLEPLKVFYPAEAYHQNYAEENPYQPYIMMNDAPKVEHLKERFPELYTK